MRSIEWKGWRRWSFPLLVIGANSIAIYVMSWTIEHFVTSALVRHLGRGAVRGARPAVRAGAAGRRDAAGVLVDSVLDVPAEDLPADLILRGSGEDGENGDAHKRRNGVNGGETERLGWLPAPATCSRRA